MALGRQVWVVLHRWSGLSIALFLAVAGITGAFLAFMHELEPLTAPAVFRVTPPGTGAPPLDGFALRDRLLARYPGAVITEVPLHIDPHASVRFGMQRFDPADQTLGPYAEDWDEVFVNPYDGTETGRRLWGDIGQGAINIMPFVNKVHFTLALGEAGRLAFGIAALIWTLDCFVGFALTLPPRSPFKQRTGGKGWFAQWRTSWGIRWRGGPYKRDMDLHRSSGLWAWPLLLVFAWSGVAFNLPQAYDPVMATFGYQPIAAGIEPPRSGHGGPGDDFRAAATNGRLIAERATKAAGAVIDESGPAAIIQYPQFGVYLYRFTSDASVSDTYGDSLVIFSALTGEPLKIVLPRRDKAGMALNAWLEALHYGAVWGLPYKIAVSLIGMAVTLLTVTGVIIWTRKRAARLMRRQRHATSN
ncbi:PepSY-associated TM helix domain-containing protein [Iodidimonas sp. SYSU 1G8]|uniref:PepSY-associated TM helix domain-containing protein n=1 Tax=Iodidimonas sp. SYSU 1G8 TaxID=3133967 RepID=UPI0031FE64EE